MGKQQALALAFKDHTIAYALIWLTLTPRINAVEAVLQQLAARRCYIDIPV